MSRQISCKTHERQDETFVCQHIVETLKDRTPRGFVWNVVDGNFEAICEACNDLSAEEFAAAAQDGNINSLCFGCFRDAAALNGIDIV